MTRSPLCALAAVLLSLIVAPLPTRADYHTVGSEFTLSNRLYNGDFYGYFSLWTNDGRSPVIIPGEPFPKPGEAQFNYYVSGSQPRGKDYPPLVDTGGQYVPLPVYGNNWQNLRVDGFAFNTDLKLSPSQFTLPPGWTVTKNGHINGFGTFTWLATASNVQSYINYGTFTIDGLGTNATPQHFMVTSQPDVGAPPPSGMVYAALHLSGLTPSALDNFATEHWVGVAMLTTPEPGSAALGLLGLGALGCAWILRRYR
jgi:hypothetical protein